MKVLLINPNRYRFPPVPPIGLEYIAASLEMKGHEVEIVDLCFSENPYEDLDNALVAYTPDIAGITVRNIDTVLYYTNEFFLDKIKEIINHIKSKHGIKVIIGGTGVLANPEGICDYLNADFAVAGPAEDGIIELLDTIEGSGDIRKVHFGRFSSKIAYHRKSSKTDYRKYFDAGGIAGFETHKGCSSSCAYCLEANSRVVFKEVNGVIEEIRDLADKGYNHFHLCDPEFNEDLDYSVDFCTALKNSSLDIKWAVYMKPANFNRKLFRLMKDTGVYLITLTVDSWKKCSQYIADIEGIIFSAKSSGLKIAVDFLCGFPYEKEETLLEYLDLFRRIQPDSVGINTHIRLYRSLPITRIVLNDDTLRKYILGNLDDKTLIEPVFYNQISKERLEELIGGDKLFRIEGLNKGVNYSRIVP